MVKKKPSRAPRPCATLVATPAGAPAIDFEKSIAEVERVVDQIEQGELGLEQSIAAYERGMTLIKACREVLTRAEQRILELTREADLPGDEDDDENDNH